MLQPFTFWYGSSVLGFARSHKYTKFKITMAKPLFYLTTRDNFDNHGMLLVSQGSMMRPETERENGFI